LELLLFVCVVRHGVNTVTANWLPRTSKDTLQIVQIGLFHQATLSVMAAFLKAEIRNSTPSIDVTA